MAFIHRRSLRGGVQIIQLLCRKEAIRSWIGMSMVTYRLLQR